MRIISQAENQIIAELTGDRCYARDIQTNKVYRSEKHPHLYWYVNTQGYYHCLKPSRVFIGDDAGHRDFSHFQITDYLVRRNGNMAESRSYGNFKTLEECIDAIEAEK